MTRYAALLTRFTGRIPRATFWWTTLFVWLIFAILFVFHEAVLGRPSTMILYPFLFFSLTAVGTKRLHDRGHSGWRLLLIVIPVVGPMWLLIALGLLRGTRGDNQYGDDPLSAGVDYLTVRAPA
jgi:uncharacterized membrane protein YhaH (DUF805 family)